MKLILSVAILCVALANASDAVRERSDMLRVGADALPIVARGKNHHRKYVFADITDAPTIPAIPVEWLVNLKNEYAREGREQAEGDLMNLLLIWQKEQEAQDG